MKIQESGTLNHDQRRRYARHLLIPEIGEHGQQMLLRSSVLVVGAGGLGAAAISYLAAAGIGRLGIVDHDHVELSNLNRQIIHESGDIGRRKTDSAADRVSEINEACRVETYPVRLAEENALYVWNEFFAPQVGKERQIVLDGSDNFATRFAVSKACHQAGIPLISGAVRGLEGQLTTFKSHLGAPHPCYRCFVPEAPPDRNDCAENGILGPLVGVLGSLMAVEAIKELLSMGDSLSGRLLRYYALQGVWKESRLLRDPACPMCG